MQRRLNEAMDPAAGPKSIALKARGPELTVIGHAEYLKVSRLQVQKVLGVVMDPDGRLAEHTET